MKTRFSFLGELSLLQRTYVRLSLFDPIPSSDLITAAEKAQAYCTPKKKAFPAGTRAEQISLIKRWRDTSGKAKLLPTSVSQLSLLKIQSRTGKQTQSKTCSSVLPV